MNGEGREVGGQISSELDLGVSSNLFKPPQVARELSRRRERRREVDLERMLVF